MFHNRTRELTFLSARFRDERAELLVVYGRRRTGKSALLREFCREKPHAYYLAAQLTEQENLEQFRRILLAEHPDPLLASMRFTDWDVALTYVARMAARNRFILVLDEFPYLCQANPALPSLLQRWWDTIGKASQLYLVLCGSHLSFMEQEVLAERSPLYGRRTGQIRLGPLLPWDAARFFPERTPRERLALYGIFGGIPAYLERVHPGQDLATNVAQEALSPLGYFYDEVSFLLRTEFTQIATYLSLLKAIAGGATRVSEIGSRVGIPATSAAKYLSVLQEMGLVRREVPATEAHPEKSKRGVYRINDPFIGFWCRFILPYQSLLEAGQADTVWREFILPALDTHLGLIFEEVCAQYVRHHWDARHGGTPLRVGRWWSPNAEIDVLALLRVGDQQVPLLSECKWWQNPVGLSVLRDLQGRVPHLPAPYRDAPRFALFSASGFTAELRDVAAQQAVTLIDSELLLTPPDGLPH
jgi:AAA+ ATPase superfamily predicted ATPase